MTCSEHAGPVWINPKRWNCFSERPALRQDRADMVYVEVESVPLFRSNNTTIPCVSFQPA